MKKMQKSVPSYPKTHEKSWIFWSNGISLLETSLQMAIFPMSKSDFQISSFSAWGTFLPKFGLSNGTFLQKRKSCIPSMKHFSVTKELFFQKIFQKIFLFWAKNRSKKPYASLSATNQEVVTVLWGSKICGFQIISELSPRRMYF